MSGWRRATVMANGPELWGDLAIETRASLQDRGYEHAPAYVVFFLADDGEEMTLHVLSYGNLIELCATFKPSRVRIDSAPGEDVSDVRAIIDHKLRLH